MIASFSIIPLDKGESVSEYVALCYDLVQESGLSHQLTPMATIIEGDHDSVMSLISRCHLAVRERSNRVLTRIDIDDRADYHDAIRRKVESVMARH